MELKFSRQIFEKMLKYQISWKSVVMWTELFLANGRTERDEANVCFLQFSERNYKRQTMSNYVRFFVKRHSKFGTKLVARFTVNFKFFLDGCIKGNSYSVVPRNMVITARIGPQYKVQFAHNSMWCNTWLYTKQKMLHSMSKTFSYSNNTSPPILGPS